MKVYVHVPCNVLPCMLGLGLSGGAIVQMLYAQNGPMTREVFIATSRTQTC